MILVEPADTRTLTDLLEYIWANPLTHDQKQWFCGTNACVAGNYAIQQFPQSYARAFILGEHGPATIEVCFLEYIKDSLEYQGLLEYYEEMFDFDCFWFSLLKEDLNLTYTEAELLTSAAANKDLHVYMLDQLKAGQRIGIDTTTHYVITNDSNLYHGNILIRFFDLDEGEHHDLVEYFSGYGGDKIRLELFRDSRLYTD